MQISDMGMILDFQKKSGYVHYVSPQMEFYKPEYKSNPEGYWTWGAIGPAGIAYNTDVVSARGGAENLAGGDRSEMEGQHHRQAVDLGVAACLLVRIAQTVRSRLLEEIRRAEPERV